MTHHHHGEAPGTHHHHGDEPEWADLLEALEGEAQLSQPWITEATAWLTGLSGARSIKQVIDVGAGPGATSCLLAELLPEAQVVAVDPTEAFLQRANHRGQKLGLGTRFSTHLGDIASGLDDLDLADLIWASHVLHHLPDPVEGLQTLGARLSGHGLLAVVEGGLPMRLLPGGYGVSNPSFVNRLEAAVSDLARDHWSLTDSAVGGSKDWPLLIADAGLEHVVSRTFLLDLPAPVDDLVRRHTIARFTNVADRVHDQLSSEDQAALARLIDPGDSASLHQRPDLFVLSAYTVHVAKRS